MFNEKQKEFIRSLGFDVDFDNLSDNECVDIEEAVADKLMYAGFEADYEINSLGRMCMDIIHIMGEID